jgi:hypothetical protein
MLVLAGAELFQLVTGGGDLEALSLDGEAEPVSDLVLDPVDLFALELDDPFTILADDVVVVRVVGVIGVVKFVVLPEIHLPDQTAFRQEREGAVNGGARDGSIAPARPFEELIGREMLIGAENGVDNGLALRRDAQILLLEELEKLLFHIGPIGRFHIPANYISVGLQVNAGNGSEEGEWGRPLTLIIIRPKPKSVIHRKTTERRSGKMRRMSASYEEIAKRAFEIWERQGRPAGCDLEHWLQAEAELRQQQDGKKPKSRKTTSSEPVLKTPRRQAERGTRSEAVM